MTHAHLGHRYLPARKGSIRWHSCGSGRPLVLLPGLSLPAVSQFLGAATNPALKDRRVHMIDFIGSGYSDVGDGHDGQPGSHAADVATACDHIGLKNVDVFGHSMGGTVAIALATIRPDLVRRLGIGEANLFPGGGVATKSIAAQSPEDWLANGYDALLSTLDAEAQGGDARSDALAAGWRQADPTMLHRNSVALVNLSADFVESFLSLGIPRTFVFGARNLPGPDREATPDAPDPAELRARGVSVKSIPDAGHAMMFDNPQAFARMLADTFAD